MNIKMTGSVAAIALCAASWSAVFAAPTPGLKAGSIRPIAVSRQRDKAQIARLRRQIAVQQSEIARLRNTVSQLQRALVATERALVNTQRASAHNARTDEKAKGVEPEATVAKNVVPPVLNFRMKNLTGQEVDLKKYQGQVVLIVNTASLCGYTPQYKGLQELHKLYAKQGLAILGFPSNDFGQQEPGSEAEIHTFCQKNYGVEFDMFSKVGVKGPEKSALYKYLTSEEANPQFAGEVQWNFEKFLIGRDGRVVSRFRSNVVPTSDLMVKAIETELAKK